MTRPPVRPLAQPLTLRHLTLRNRIVFGAHTNKMAEDGEPSARQIAYLAERARGGAAMVVVEPMPVHPAAVLTRGNFAPGTDRVIPAFRRLTEAVKAEGAAVLQQLDHVGAHADQGLPFHPGWSPSGGPSRHDSDASHAMTAAEIGTTIDGFVAAARRRRDAGFDGVEVRAVYHSLLDQFRTPFSNARDDDWGGRPENRTRLSRTICERIRATCGDDFVIGLAVSDDAGSAPLLGRESMAEIVARHDRDGLVDHVTVGAGSYLDFTHIMPTFQAPESLGADPARVLKGVVRQAVVTAEAGIRTAENADAVIASGAADLVSIVRGQIADPFMAQKAVEERAGDVRGCFSCNQMCWGRRGRDYWISCLIDPSVGREFKWGGDRFTRSERPGRVLVVGAGPAGLEAAPAAAEQGFAVTLAEASGEAGVQRALPHLPALPGIERGRVWSPEGVLSRRARLGERVIVVDEGGNWRGDRTAWALAEAGHRVTLVTPDAMVGKELQRSAADGTLRRRLAALGVRWMTEAAVTEWLGHGGGAQVVSLRTGSVERIDADDLVLATANRADGTLAADLAARGIAAAALGDAAAPRMAALAFHDGRRWALSLGARTS